MNDNEIVKRILDGGDSSCFALIVRRHSAMVFARALSVTHDEDLAADITQERRPSTCPTRTISPSGRR